MPLKIDLSALYALQKRTEDELAKVPEVMKNIASFGAQYERDHHEYQNRTGNLERSTKARLVLRSIRLTRVDLEMSADYASFIVAKRLSDILPLAKDTEEDIEKALTEIRERIAKG